MNDQTASFPTPPRGTVLASAPELCRLGVVELAKLIRARKVSVRHVITAYLDHIERTNPAYNAIVTLQRRDILLMEADGADNFLARGGEAGPLHGVPMAIK